MKESVHSYLRGKGFSAVDYEIDRKTSTNLELRDIDLAISLGGDGTILSSARLAAPYDIPILPVNLGDFGFITEVAQNEWEQVFEKYQQGFLGISKHIMVDVRVIRNGVETAAFTGLNDAVISAAGISKLVRLYLSISSTEVGKYRADGIIIATPTGSTAYSASAGGPILDPEMEAMIINPICPFTLSNRPLVIQGDSHIFITVQEEQRTDVILTVDGQETFELLPNDTVEIVQAAKKALIIRSDKRNFFEVLRSKLNWSGGPDA